MNQPVVWVHGDCLSPYGPALKAYPDARPWVWDEADRVAAESQTPHFIYECLLELLL